MTRNEITRRQLIGGLAAAGLVGLPAFTRRGEAAEKEKKKGNPQLSACIEAVFRTDPRHEALDKVAESGLKVYEFWGFGNKDLDAFARKNKELGLKTAIFSCDSGGALVAPGSDEKFVGGAKRSIEAAKKLDCNRLIVTVGQERDDIPRAEQHANIVKACKAVAPLFEDAGMILCIEPLNVLVNHKGYFLYSSKEGFEIVDEVGSPNVKILFDIYHQQISEGNVIRNITNNIDKIGHFHVADVPGRHQPGTGEINYHNVFKAIAESGYDAYLGLEMWPTGDNMTAVKHTKEIFDKAVAA